MLMFLGHDVSVKSTSCSSSLFFQIKRTAMTIVARSGVAIALYPPKLDLESSCGATSGLCRVWECSHDMDETNGANGEWFHGEDGVDRGGKNDQ